MATGSVNSAPIEKAQGRTEISVHVVYLPKLSLEFSTCFFVYRVGLFFFFFLLVESITKDISVIIVFYFQLFLL